MQSLPAFRWRLKEDQGIQAKFIGDKFNKFNPPSALWATKCRPGDSGKIYRGKNNINLISSIPPSTLWVTKGRPGDSGKIYPR